MANTVLNPPIFTATSFIFISQASDLNDNKIWFHLNNSGAAVSTAKVKYQLWGQNSGIPSEVEEVDIVADGELYYIDNSDIPFSYDTFYNFRISAFVEDDPTRKWSDIISIMRASEEDLLWELPTNNYTLSPTEKLNVKVNLDTGCQDQIARFKVEIEDASDNIVYGSGAILNNKSYAQLVIPYNFLNAGPYTINVICITNYGYVLAASREFTVDSLAIEGNITLNVTNVIELGTNRLTFADGVGMGIQILLKIYRTKTNENQWILIKEDYWQTSGSTNYYIWDDRTISSDEGYQYECICTYGSNNPTLIQLATVLPISFEHDYLTDSTAQLTIQYNKDLSGYRYNTNDAITATIGSQYPFIRRASAAKYRTFTIGGMITFNTEAFYAAVDMQDSISHTDLEHMFEFAKLFHGGNDDIDSTTIVFNKDSEFVQNLLNYKKEVYLERIFRNAVEDFLYSNTVKLFRSATEGNIFVKLTNVQLTPEKQLGRMIYSFSATATEVGAFNEANLKEFDFIDQVGEAVPVHITDYAIFATAVNDGVAQGVNSSDIIQVVNNEYKVQLQPFARLIFF